MPDEESAKKGEKKSLAKDKKKCATVKSADIPSGCLVVLGPCIRCQTIWMPGLLHLYVRKVGSSFYRFFIFIVLPLLSVNYFSDNPKKNNY